ncbi:bacillithiol biosynthesis cysteine-adding enzyme BshC [Bacillus sp. REN16]|uniref:bacillithiol biosynthesis cysteine-adding enzyme BshC n=1 Tax=Bacillus sp. REN16 TaxID=2887296 RepID=UPI001E2D010E|nr:bacillithiol biosynthesis cysteine-adding enzyme BshC [Bacillus sp. REN16]MCC3357574.1 bacillithiol biosynthesis cysteine-adding enzyme BshC [Bacillus sp. REN16]
MEVLDLSLPSSNRLVNDYLSSKMKIEKFFDYDIQSPLVYEVRKKDLQKRHFEREKLVDHLLSFNKRLNYHTQTIDNINKLLDPRSVVVIGGQQAGVLTGPLYTIHKIVSIIKLAKEQEEKLNVPVIPVFWIAGEDHDFAEINHLYVNLQNGIRKRALPQYHNRKMMVSSIEIEQNGLMEWIKEVFETYGETNYTNGLLELLNEYVQRSNTYVEFFIQIINELFGETGLVLVDSGSKEIRTLQSQYLRKMIEKNRDIHDSLLLQQEVLSTYQYPKTIEMNESSANLFFTQNNERILLEYNVEHDIFSGKNNECILCGDELLEIAEKQPELLSNNVITRPVMQEFLFPTLAFISGPGEVSYWAELKQVFAVMGIKMPPVVPRLMMTIVERAIDSNIDEIGLTIQAVLNGELSKARETWLEKQTADVDGMILEAKKEVERIHKKVRKVGLEVDPGLADLLLKNAEIIQHQFEFLKNTFNRSILKRNEIELNRFNRIEKSLLPLGSPQERLWNVFYFLNKYGDDFIKDLLALPFEFNGKHKVIKL